jgi:hypothetical protein
MGRDPAPLAADGLKKRFEICREIRRWSRATKSLLPRVPLPSR